jgi:hypothetical protein
MIATPYLPTIKPSNRHKCSSYVAKGREPVDGVPPRAARPYQPPPVKPSSRSLGGLESRSTRSNGASSGPSQQEKDQVEDANRKQAARASHAPILHSVQGYSTV